MTDESLHAAPLGTVAADGAVLARNHDRAASHHLAVRVYGPSGDVVHESGFDLSPGAAAARPADLSAGMHTVEVDRDGERYVAKSFRLEDERGLLVAVGNGAIDVAPLPGV